MGEAPALRHPAWLIGGIAVLALALTVRGLLSYLPPSLWWQVVWQPNLDDMQQLLVVYSFLPRLVTSLLCGAALALAATIFQQVLRNPLAEPTTLGISAGASLALTLALAFAPGLLAHGREWIALLGGGLAAAVGFGLAAGRKLSPNTLVLAGMIVALYCGALAAGVQIFKNPYVHAFYLWGAGSLSQQDWSVVLYLLPRLAVAIVLAAALVRPLTVLGLDEQGARGLGLPLFSVRLAAFAIAVALSAIVTSAVGIIGFIGLAAPAVARLAGARRFGAQLLWAPPLGAGLLCLTDQLVQWASLAGRELVPTGAATALIGAPILLVLLPRLRPGGSPPPGETHDGFGQIARPWLLVAGAALALLILVFVSLHLGQNGRGWQWSSPQQLEPLLRWRGPRLVGALAAGSLLAMAGAFIQRITGNPMAAPEILGISGGAALGLIFLIILVPDTSRFAQLGAGTAGAFGVLALVLLLGRRSAYAPDRILLAGITAGALSGVFLTTFMASGSPRAAILQNWMAGSTNLTTPQQALFAGIAALLALLVAPLFRRWLDILPLAPATPRALGLDPGRSRLILMAFIALLTAVATLSIGPLGFVGLMGPHLARLAGLRRPLPQLVGAALFGGLIMVAADWLGRTILFPYQVPAGLIATLIGGPYLMLLLQRRPV